MKALLGGENGSSAVEFALVLPILIMLIFGVVEFGIAFGDFLAITHAAREGARLAAVGRFSEQTVRERAYPVNPTSISVTYPEGETHGQPVDVRVEYLLHLSIPFFGARSLPLIGEARMRLEG